jgi:hypothetical protein
MSKAKPTAATVIEESAISRIDPIPQIPSTWVLPTEPSWDRARSLVADVRRSISSIINLGMEIQALHDEYFAQGSRTDRMGRSAATANVSKGWQQVVQDELGISHVTAIKIIERAYSVVCMRRIEEGEPVEYEDQRTHEKRNILPTEDLQQQATQALEAVISGTVAAPRAWAGLVGEASRRAAQGGSAARAATDHGRNLMRAIIALHNSLQQWKHISPEERLVIEKRWQSVLARLPETMRP